MFDCNIISKSNHLNLVKEITCLNIRQPNNRNFSLIKGEELKYVVTDEEQHQHARYPAEEEISRGPVHRGQNLPPPRSPMEPQAPTGAKHKQTASSG